MALNSLGPNPDLSTPALAIQASRDLRCDLSARFTKPTTAADLDYSLCSRCRVIGFDSVFEAADSGDDLNGTIIADAGVLTEASTESACRLCAFLAHVRLSSYNGSYGQRSWKLCAFDSLAVRGFPRTKASRTETPSIILTLIADETTLVGNHQHASFIVPIRWSQTRSQQHSLSVYRARQLCASSINYSLIKEWLRDCESGHTSCRLQRPIMKPIKVIDCLQRKIIASGPDTEYFALSYVWGKQSKDGEESRPNLGNDELPHNTPSVIWDAMTMVASLGFHNLWVDRFCIDQGNVEEKHQQISQMDAIYEGALATIIVAPSKAADEGIPGVSFSRTATPCVRISKKISLQSLSSMEQSLQASQWNSRGWTYQEYCLSRRCLIVADDQVHFVCRRGMTCEGVQEAALSYLPFEKRRCLDVGTLDSLCVSRDPTFVRQLSAYTKRVLSYDSDRLNAFRGLLSRSQLASYWGVPIYDTDSSPELTAARLEVRELESFHLGFSLGLCWTTHSLERPVRRLNFIDSKSTKCEALPSWSWVSGRRVMRYPYFGNPRNNEELWVDKTTIEVFAEIFLDDPSSVKHESIHVVTKSPGCLSRVIPERSPFIYIRSVVKAIPPQAWSQFEKHVAWDCGNQPTQFDTPLEMILLIYQRGISALGPLHFYMVVTMDGDIAHRLGLACIFEKDESSLVVVHERKTVKVG